MTAEANEAVALRVAARSQEVFDELWNEVTYAVDHLTGEHIEQKVVGRLRATELDRRNVTEVQVLVVIACQEEHWWAFVDLPVKWFGRAFRWLERGHLPCGLVGRFPSVAFKAW